MALAGDFEVIRDPLWNNIQIDVRALGVIDSAPFQRLRYVRQLGHAFLVYPGATHTRFEHALGAYHLAGRTLGVLRERGELEGIPEQQVIVVRLAALLHDVGHYPFSHALEEAGLPSHERLAVERFAHPELRRALEAYGIASLDTALAALIAGSSGQALQGLVAGSLDLDKIEYLTRDARMCGVPYGTVDVDRLIHSITLVGATDAQRRVGVHEKGLSALESLLFAKYQMYRNVYWHHAVRSATAMFKRLVRRAIAGGHLNAGWIAGSTDESLMEAVRGLPDTDLPHRLRRRQLYKRRLDLPADAVPVGGGDWIANDPDLLERVEDRLAEELGARPGDVLLDYPAKPAMLAVDLPLLMRDGRPAHLDAEHRSTLLGIQQVADDLHMSARRLRVFAADSLGIPQRGVLALTERSAGELAADLADGRTLLGSR
ncbi:MAG: HD domain-containing protein [Gemmatimonadales bacterium]|jgi:HD superfamily phosphohydrolase